MIEALGNLGDFIGGIGVVVTLVYLAGQIRQNSRSVKAASAQAMLGSLGMTLNSIGASPQASRVFALGQLDPSQLDEDEVSQFAHLILGWFRIVEQAFHHYERGGLDPELWEGHVAQLKSFIQSPSVQRWWSVRAPLFHPEFRRFIEEIRGESTVPTLGDALQAIRGESAPPA